LEEKANQLNLEIKATHLGYDSKRNSWMIQFKHLPLKDYSIEGITAVTNKEDLNSIDGGWYFEKETGELTIKIQQPTHELVRLNVSQRS
jgi:hypothetical protein